MLRSLVLCAGALPAPYTHYPAAYNTGGTNTVHTGGKMASYPMLPVMPPKKWLLSIKSTLAPRQRGEGGVRGKRRRIFPHPGPLPKAGGRTARIR